MAERVKRQLGKNVLLLGVGYSARALISPLKVAGYNVMGTSRSAGGTEALGIEIIRFDGSISADLRAALGRAHIILSSIPPRDDGDPFLEAIDHNLVAAAPKLEWAGYLSATSVYGDRGGQWAFEDELLRPATQRGKNRAEAEMAWLETNAPVHIFRLAGIYGPEIFGMSRNPLTRLRAGKARAVIKPGHIVNRIHVEDIASAVMTSIESPRPQRIYNLADDEPAPPQDVITYGADLLGIDRPAQIGHESAELSDMARSFYTETKRISNARAKAELGWVPKYSNYRIGLMSVLKSEKDNPNIVMLSGALTVDQQSVPAVKKALPAHIKATQQEPGCLRFDVWQDPNKPNTFHVFETFGSPAAFKAHQKRMEITKWFDVTKNAKRLYDVVGL